MTAIIIIGILALLAIVVVQIGKLSDLRSKIMGEEDINYQNYDITGKLLLFFMIGVIDFVSKRFLMFGDIRRLFSVNYLIPKYAAVQIYRSA